MIYLLLVVVLIAAYCAFDFYRFIKEVDKHFRS